MNDDGIFRWLPACLEGKTMLFGYHAARTQSPIKQKANVGRH